MLADIQAAALVLATFFSLTAAEYNSRGLFADHEIRYTVPSPYLHRLTATEMQAEAPHYTSTRTIQRIVYTTVHLPRPHTEATDMQTPHYTSTRTVKRIVYTTIHLAHTEVGEPVQGFHTSIPTHAAIAVEVPSPWSYDSEQMPMESDEHIEMLRQYRDHEDLKRRDGIMNPPLPAYDVPTTHMIHGPKPTGEPCALGQNGCIAAPGAVSLVGNIVEGIKSQASATGGVPAATSATKSVVRESANSAEGRAGAGGEGVARVAFLVAVAGAVVGVGSGFA